MSSMPPKPQSWTFARHQLVHLAFNNVRFEIAQLQGKQLLNVLGYFSGVDQLVLNNISTSHMLLPMILTIPLIELPILSHHLIICTLNLTISLLTGDYLNVIHKTVSYWTLNSFQVSCSSADQFLFIGNMIWSMGYLKHFNFNFHPFGFLGNIPG